MSTLEIHGYVGCPFAWRTRIAARLKGVAFDWIPCSLDADAPAPSPAPDPRSAAHNPDKRSPLLWDDGFSLTESSIIVQYVDESRPGRALQPTDARERASARVAAVELGRLMLPHADDKSAPPPPAAVQKVLAALASLEKRLAQGGAFVDGDAPGFVDVHVWPSLALLADAKVDIPAEHAKARAYWERARVHEAYTTTKPPWAP